MVVASKSNNERGKRLMRPSLILGQNSYERRFIVHTPYVIFSYPNPIIITISRIFKGASLIFWIHYEISSKDILHIYTTLLSN